MLFEVLGLLLMVLMLICCVLVAVRRYRLLTQGVQSLATVVSWQERHHPEDGTTYHAVLKFMDPSGICHTAECEDGGRWKHPAEGCSVMVRYQPLQPKTVVIDSFFNGWGTVWISGLVAFLLVIFLIGAMFEMRH